MVMILGGDVRTLVYSPTPLHTKKPTSLFQKNRGRKHSGVVIWPSSFTCIHGLRGGVKSYTLMLLIFAGLNFRALAKNHLSPEMNASIVSEYFISYWALYTGYFHILHIWYNFVFCWWNFNEDTL